MRPEAGRSAIGYHTIGAGSRKLLGQASTERSSLTTQRTSRETMSTQQTNDDVGIDSMKIGPDDPRYRTVVNKRFNKRFLANPDYVPVALLVFSAASARVLPPETAMWVGYPAGRQRAVRCPSGALGTSASLPRPSFQIRSPVPGFPRVFPRNKFLICRIATGKAVKGASRATRRDPLGGAAANVSHRPGTRGCPPGCYSSTSRRRDCNRPSSSSSRGCSVQ